MKLLFFTLLVNSVLFSQQDSIPVHHSFKLDSKIMGEARTINVWIPTGYENSQNKIPVLYMLDGGIQEDFPHIANTLAELIANKSIQPMMLVGIENTNRRRDLTGFSTVKKHEKMAPLTDGAAIFRSFIKDELFTEISKRYNVTEEKGIIGESLAGLFVVETFLLTPQLFDCYIAFDPSLWWNNGYLVKTAKENMAKHATVSNKLWFAGSDAKDIYKHTRKLDEILKEINSSQLSWVYSDEPNEQHNTIFRSKKVEALKWTFGVEK